MTREGSAERIDNPELSQTMQLVRLRIVHSIAPDSFSMIVQFVRVGAEFSSQRSAPALSAKFPVRRQLVRIGEELTVQCSPAPLREEFPMIVQFVRVGEQFCRQSTPAPNLPKFPEIVQRESCGEEPFVRYAPPPLCSPSRPAMFESMVQSIRVGEDSRQ